MSKLKGFRVSFAIDVEAKTPEEACARAWELLTGEGAMLPIGEVEEHSDPYADTVEVDLQEIHDSQSQPPEAATGGQSGV